MTEQAVPEVQPKRLGEMLIEAGTISEGQLNEALIRKEAEGGFLGKILIDMKYIDEHTLINFLVKQFKIPHISLLDYDIAPEVAQMLPKEICTKYHLIPIDKLGKILTIAMVDPLDTEAMVQVKEACPDIRIKPILCSWAHFEHVLLKAYPDAKMAGEKAAPANSGGVTMESLGLSASSDQKKPAKKPDPKPAAQAPPAADVLPPSAEEILSAIDETVQLGIEHVMVLLADRLHAFIVAGNGTLPVKSSEIAEQLRASVADATEAASGEILQDMKEALEKAQKPASEINALELGQILQSSMRRALHGASTEILEEAARAIANRSGNP